MDNDYLDEIENLLYTDNLKNKKNLKQNFQLFWVFDNISEIETC